ncbi:hypothetical protein BK669_20240 [Pseudomonas fluorescens]|nr:hypothetical protein BK669_20240 [Pseudomonas fluorescens]
MLPKDTISLLFIKRFLLNTLMQYARYQNVFHLVLSWSAALMIAQSFLLGLATPMNMVPFKA